MRNLLIEALNREAFEKRVVAEVEAIDQRIEATASDLGQRVDKLRENLANAVLGLLVEFNKGLPKDKQSSAEALKNWVKKTFAS